VPALRQGPSLQAALLRCSGTNFGSSATGATVQLNGINAPLFSVSPTQINFQVPWELASQSSASMTVTVGGLTSNTVTVLLSSYGPGIIHSNLAGQGAVVTANTTSISAPSKCPLANSGNLI